MEQDKQTPENNWFLKWWSNIKNTRTNFKKVRASPYASLTLALKARKIIIGCLIPWLLYMTYSMVMKIHTNGVFGTIQRVIMIGMMGYIIWKIYSTIPQAKKQIEHYKKFPHLINYCPTNTKQTVDEILDKIKDNQTKLQMEDKNVRKKETRSKTSPGTTSTTTTENRGS